MLQGSWLNQRPWFMAKKFGARALLDSSFQVICYNSLTSKRMQSVLGPMTVIWYAWCLHFGTLGDDFGSLGARWGAKGAAEAQFRID